MEAYKHEINTFNGIIWLGEVLMGSTQTEMDCVFDTGSDWLVVEAITCDNCEGTDKYTPTEPSATRVGTTLSTRTYGNA